MNRIFSLILFILLLNVQSYSQDLVTETFNDLLSIDFPEKPERTLEEGEIYCALELESGVYISSSVIDFSQDEEALVGMGSLKEIYNLVIKETTTALDGELKEQSSFDFDKSLKGMDFSYEIEMNSDTNEIGYSRLIFANKHLIHLMFFVPEVNDGAVQSIKNQFFNSIQLNDKKTINQLIGNEDQRTYKLGQQVGTYLLFGFIGIVTFLMIRNNRKKKALK